MQASRNQNTYPKLSPSLALPGDNLEVSKHDNKNKHKLNQFYEI